MAESCGVVNFPDSKSPDDPGDAPTNQPHAIERLLGKPLLPLTQLQPYKIPEEVWGGLEDLELLVQKKNALRDIGKN